MNRTTELDAFISLVESGSAQAAAIRMGVSPVSIRRKLKRLEADLGVKLVKSITRNLILSEAGESLYESVSKIMGRLDATLSNIESYAVEPVGSIKLVVTTSLMQRELEKLFGDFSRKYNDIAINVMHDDQNIDFINDHLDAAIVLGQPSDSGLVARKILDNVPALCATPRYLAGRPAIKSPVDLLQHQCLTLDGKGAFSERWTFYQHHEKQAVKIRPFLSTNDISTLLEWTLDSRGIGVLGQLEAEYLCDQGDLIRVLPEYRMPNLDLYLIYAGRNQLPMRVRLFIDFISDNLHLKTDTVQDCQRSH